MFGPYALVLLAAHHHPTSPSRRCCGSSGVRNNPPWLFLVALVVLIGMWLERYVIVVTSLHRDYLPSSWGMYSPTVWDWSMFLGTIGFFFALMFLFIRFLPMISIAEMQTLLPEAKVHDDNASEEKP